MAEFAIPLRSLRYASQKPQVWGLNFMRNIRRKREQDYWSPVSRIYNLYRLSSAGELHGLELETPRNFKVTPYVIASAARDYSTTRSTDYDGDAGIDAKFGVTPSLNLDLTYNTDFAQVEVDEQQINLTRFNLFFPEKRPFFLENAGLFAVGKGRSVDLFFSRRIGIHQGSEVSILGGARLSGKAGEYNVGILNMQTDNVPGVTPANNFTVARLKRELPNRSSFGAIVVSRSATGQEAGSDDWNRTWGLDGKLGIGDNLTFSGFLARTETPGQTGLERAWNIRGEYKRLSGRTWLEFTEVGAGFNPEVGFLRRKNYRNIDTGVFTNLRFTSIPWLRELRPHTTYRVWHDLDGFKESEQVHFDTHFDFESGAFFSPAVNVTLEGLKEPFRIAGTEIEVAPGSYRNVELDWRIYSDRSAPLSASAQIYYGGFLSGDQRSLSLTVAGRRGSDLTSSIRWEYNNIDLLEGEFQTNLIQWRFNYSFTPLVYLQSLIQYNDLINNWSANMRLGWLNTAGTGLFVVYNETQGLRGLGPIDRNFIIKYTRQFDVLTN